MEPDGLQRLNTAEGRELEFLVEGPESEVALVFHFGTPTAAVPVPQVTDPAGALGLRTVTYSRPGYAASTPVPGRSVADAAMNTEAVLEAIDADRFVTLGWSGGGPHALACAALLPGRCAAAATLGSVAPWGVPGLDWLAGMGPENVEEFGAALEGEESLTRFLERVISELGAITADHLAAALGGLLSEVDRAAFDAGFGDIMAASFRRAVSSGVAGWRDDDLAFTQPWGFELAAIRVPVTVWQGAQDRMVPFEHGRWLADNVPGARARLFEDEGHLSFVAQMGRILEDLTEQAKLS